MLRLTVEALVRSIAAERRDWLMLTYSLVRAGLTASKESSAGSMVVSSMKRCDYKMISDTALCEKKKIKKIPALDINMC